jgi:hypothetical protein
MQSLPLRSLRQALLQLGPRNLQPGLLEQTLEFAVFPVGWLGENYQDAGEMRSNKNGKEKKKKKKTEKKGGGG